MEKYISVSKETMGRLRRIFSVNGKPLCERSVKNALDYSSNSELAKKIRFTALQNGGRIYSVCEEMKCFFDSNDIMHNVFPNGAEIHLDKKTGEGIIYDRKGRVVARYTDVHVTTIPEIQAVAASL